MGDLKGGVFSKLIKGLALWTFFYPVRWFIQCLPWRISPGIGNILGSVHVLFISDKLKRQIRDGIHAVWQDRLTKKEISHIVRLNLVIRYKYLIDSFLYPHLDKNVVQRIVPEIEGKSYLDEEIRCGRGSILLMSHFGSFGMLIAGLVFRGYRVHQILTLTPQSQYRTWQWLERAIMKAKLHCWEHEKVVYEFWQPGMYLRPLYRKLQQGEILVIYGDGAKGGEFTKVSFMGHPLLLATGPFRIAARARVSLIPAFIIRETDNTHRIVLEKPILLREDDPESITLAAGQYASLLARYVQTYPDHWFTWARLRWATRERDRWLEFASGKTDSSEFYDPIGQNVGAG